MIPITVAIAEDDERIALIQSEFLNQLEGVEVIGIAHSLSAARDLVRLSRPNLLFLDIQFPDGSGLDLVKEIRKGQLQVDIIMVTAAREVEMLKTALHGGIFDYIVKPLVFDRIRVSLDRYREHVERLGSLKQLNQQNIDAILPRGRVENADSQPVPPKGVDPLTLAKIRGYIYRSPRSFAASEIGGELGVSRTTARRYLEYLVSTRELKVDITYGGVGRPERHYSMHRNKP
ncbi:MAG: response regulator [Gammaproteobacteria bacterium]|nr:response regulator [Gammaproteobacteria bacterium]